MAMHLNQAHVPTWTENFVRDHYVNLILAAVSGMNCCGCGRFYIATQYGRNKHRGDPTNCTVMAECDSWAQMQENNVSSLPAGLRMEQYGTATMDNDGSVAITGPPGVGTRRFKIVDCGHEAGNDVYCCLYKAYLGIAADHSPEVVRFKARVAPMATAIARSRGRNLSFGARGILGE
jgi:hypothetical protein